jgi:hypothetical protein
MSASPSYSTTSGAANGNVSSVQVLALLESADFSVERPATVVVGKTGRRIPVVRRYRRNHLRSALIGMWRAATSPGGREIQLFASVKTFAEGANRCERSMRYVLRALEQLGILEVRHKANTIRRPTTYALNVEKLQSTCTHGRRKVAPVTPIARPMRSEHRRVESAPKPKLSKAEAAKFVADMALCIRGQTGKTGVDGLWIDFRPSDPRYLAPMKWREALRVVSKQWLRTEESAIEALIHWGYQVETEKEGGKT